MKKVLLVIIDALASRVVRPAMETGSLPHLRALARAGWVDWSSTAIFPSITPAATAALVTGGYPTQTGISGAYYYDHDEGRVHYYGDDIWSILRKGFGEFFGDFLVRLNRDHLRTDTLFQRVERAGGRAASLNYLWFHADRPHRAHIPWMLRLWPRVPASREVFGPSILSLGDFVAAPPARRRSLFRPRAGARRRFGFDDKGTAEVLVALARDGMLPDLTVAYFPDNDFDSHEYGPLDALTTLEKVDASLGELIAVWGSLDAMLHQVAVIVTGDHSQTDLAADPQQRAVRLGELLENFNVARPGREWENDDQLMVCQNLRAAQIYFGRTDPQQQRDVADALLADERIDQVIFREGSGPGADFGYRVLTRERGTLEFRPADAAGDSMDAALDEYDTPWIWSGDLETVDARVAGSGRLEFGDYPNAFERIATAFDDRVSGDLWVTCRPGFEFGQETIDVHRAGSHGSLHALDSLSPLLVAGTQQRLERTPRSVDVAPLVCSILGVPSPHAPGESRLRPRRREAELGV